MVHGDLSRVVIFTNRVSVAHARGYVTFLLRALASNDLLEWLVLPVTRTWHALLWRDAANWAGLREPSLSPPPGYSFENVREAHGGEGDEGDEGGSQARAADAHGCTSAI